MELVNQYLDYVRQMENADFDVAGDFLEMALPAAEIYAFRSSSPS